VVKCVDSENNVCDTNLSVPGTDNVVCHDVGVCSKGSEVSVSSRVWEVIIESCGVVAWLLLFVCFGACELVCASVPGHNERADECNDVVSVDAGRRVNELNLLSGGALAEVLANSDPAVAESLLECTSGTSGNTVPADTVQPAVESSLSTRGVLPSPSAGRMVVNSDLALASSSSECLTGLECGTVIVDDRAEFGPISWRSFA
jgi:hypothetical protein